MRERNWVVATLVIRTATVHTNDTVMIYTILVQYAPSHYCIVCIVLCYCYCTLHENPPFNVYAFVNAVCNTVLLPGAQGADY